MQLYILFYFFILYFHTRCACFFFFFFFHFPPRSSFICLFFLCPRRHGASPCSLSFPDFSKSKTTIQLSLHILFTQGLYSLSLSLSPIDTESIGLSGWRGCLASIQESSKPEIATIYLSTLFFFMICKSKPPFLSP